MRVRLSVIAVGAGLGLSVLGLAGCSQEAAPVAQQGSNRGEPTLAERPAGGTVSEEAAAPPEITLPADTTPGTPTPATAPRPIASEETRLAAARQLVGRWKGEVELNEEVALKMGLPAPVVKTLQSMKAMLEFHPSGEAVMIATTKTDDGPQEVEVHAHWGISQVEENAVTIAWQEDKGKMEAVQVNFEGKDIFTRPPPGNQANLDIGQMRFTRMR
ncbi:hypothetical protein [Lignipirellula cremea]|nr:hypothetical protein [Lignipirellula cremea]